MVRRTLCLVVFILTPLIASLNPETGIPVFQHYTSEQYGGGHRNWASFRIGAESCTSAARLGCPSTMVRPGEPSR